MEDRNRKLFELWELQQRDADIKIMVEIVCRAENCQLAELSDEQLELLHEEAMSLIDQLGADT